MMYDAAHVLKNCVDISILVFSDSSVLFSAFCSDMNVN